MPMKSQLTQNCLQSSQWLMQTVAELEDTLTQSSTPSKTVTLRENKHFPKLAENLQYAGCTIVTQPKQGQY